MSKRNKIKVVITGATGMLGRSVYKHLTNTGTNNIEEVSIQSNQSNQSNKYEYEYECIGTGWSRAASASAAAAAAQSSNNNNNNIIPLNLRNPNDITNFIHQHQPNIVIHCAAQRFPDQAERHPEETIQLNVDSTIHLAKECRNINALFIYISTDYVFDGGLTSKIYPPYESNNMEHDKAMVPVNIYGQSKLDGERGILSIQGLKVIIVRVPVLYALDCYDLSESATLVVAKSLLPLLSSISLSSSSSSSSLSEDDVTVIDHWGIRFPTLVDDVSCVLKLIINAISNNNNIITTHPIHDTMDKQNGKLILHISSSEQCTKYELALLMADILGIDKNIQQERINPNVPSGAPRPQNTQLNCNETWRVLNNMDPFKFTPLNEGIRKALVPFMDKLQKEI